MHYSQGFAISALFWVVFSFAFAGEREKIVSGDTANSLEQAIYLEHTVGDIEAASKLYKQIIYSDNNQQKYVAEASLRLAQCHLKEGKILDAKILLTTVIQRYKGMPEIHRTAVTLARSIDDIQNRLLPVPWKDGEILEYECHINDVLLEYMIRILDKNKNSWTNHVYFINAQAEGHYTSRTIFDKNTNETVRINKPGETIQLENHQIVLESTSGKNIHVPISGRFNTYNNIFELIRRIPLSLNTPVKISSFNTRLMEYNKLTLELVDEQEIVKTKTGKFNTSRIKVGRHNKDGAVIETIQFWRSNDKNRYIVRHEDGACHNELYSIRNSSEPDRIYQASDSFGIQIPASWGLHDNSTHSKREIFQLVTPLKGPYVHGRLVTMPESKDLLAASPIEKLMEWNITWNRANLQNYQLIKDETKFFKIGEKEALRYLGTYDENGQNLLIYRLIVKAKDQPYQLSFLLEEQNFEAVRPELDKIFSNVKTR